MTHELSGVDVLILSILVLWLGNVLTRRITLLRSHNIPEAVTGGLLCSIVVALLNAFADLRIDFDLRTRDVLLLVFFSTIGLGARFRTLAAGGRSLVVLLVAAAVFLFLQNSTGVGLALLLGEHPGYGLFGGSVSFAGGHGTAIAWGAEAEEAGLTGASTVGIAFATFGLIAGGLLGGPLAGRLVRGLPVPPKGEPAVEAAARAGDAVPAETVSLRDILGTILLLALCVKLGDSVNQYLFSAGVLLPGFLTAMLVGIALTNLADLRGARMSETAISTTGDVALSLFLSMSLMSMDLTSLTAAAAPIVLVLFCQMALITLFAVFLVFRVLGRDYDAAVISAGFVGLGLGATPVAIANMHAVCGRFGPSPKAFLVVPLVGAFFIDLLNAIIIKFFIALPVMQEAAV